MLQKPKEASPAAGVRVGDLAQGARVHLVRLVQALEVQVQVTEVQATQAHLVHRALAFQGLRQEVILHVRIQGIIFMAQVTMVASAWDICTIMDS